MTDPFEPESIDTGAHSSTALPDPDPGWADSTTSAVNAPDVDGYYDPVEPRADTMDYHRADYDRREMLRVPTFSPLGVVVGWVAAWGAIAIATAILERVNVPTGFNLGIANGGPGHDGLWAGIWALVVSGGAFVLGGYTAARLARANGTRHAILMWAVAMVATGADALFETARDGTHGMVRLIIGVPFWAETGLTNDTKAVIVLAIFAGVSLVGALIGGGLGQTANSIDRTDIITEA